MPSLIWTPHALADLQRLYRVLAGKDIDSARRAVKALRAGVKILMHQPRIGRPVADMELSFREWLVAFGNSGYVALYRFEDDTITILAIQHQKEAGY